MDDLCLKFPRERDAVRSSVSGRNHSRSLHGHRMDVLKSCIQKYVRRGMRDEGVRCVMEMDLLGLCRADAEWAADAGAAAAAKNKISAVKGIRTNMANRLAVCAGEDCLDPAMVPAFVSKFKLWCHKDTRDTARGMALLVGMHDMLSYAKKGRVASVVKLFVNRDALPPEWRSKWGARVSPPDGETFHSLLARGDLRFAGFVRRPSSADEPEREASRGRMSEEEAWRAMASFEWRNSVLRDAAAAFKDLSDAMRHHKERFVFLYQVMYLACCDRLAGTALISAAAYKPRECSAEQAMVMYERYLSGETRPATIESFCVDVHTSAGKAAGMTPVEFAHEGATVANVNAVLLPADLAAVYECMYKESKTTAAPDNKRKRSSGPAPSRPLGPLEPSRQGVAAAKRIKKTDEYFAGELRRALRNCTEVFELSGPEMERAGKMKAQTCGNKAMTFGVRSGGGPLVVVKPATELDPIIIDACKPAFGLKRLNVRLVRARMKAVTVHPPVEPILAPAGSRAGKGTALKRWRRPKPAEGPLPTYILCPTDDLRPFLVMDFVGDAASGTAGKAKTSGEASEEMFGSPALIKEYIKIAMFRALFRVTDFTQSNVLVHRGELYSIDENGAGRCQKVFPHGGKDVRRSLARNPRLMDLAAGELLSDFDVKMESVAAVLKAHLGCDGKVDRVVEAVRAEAKTLLERAREEMKPVR